MRIESRACLLLLALATACGGRSTLDRGETGSSGPEASDPDPADPQPGTPDPSPGDPSPNPGSGPSPDPGSGPSPDPGSGPSPDPGTPTPDPGTPNPGPGPSSDVNCTSDHAKGGMACTKPCATTCGYYDMGTKACDCVSGVFVSCGCPRPWNYQGRTTAPKCDTSDGRTHWIDNTACTEEWAQCIGSDPVTGTNPRGCVCLTDPVNGKLEWTCGSTNRWFLPE